MSIDGAKKSKRGRPRVDSDAVNVRFEREALAAIDAWIGSQPDPKPSRPEAVRRLVAAALNRWDREKGKLKQSSA